MAKTRKNKQKKTLKNNKTLSSKTKVYTKKHFNSGDGMLTSVWGPSLWHYLHTISFNYPVNPTKREKKHYKNFIYSLKYVLPCKYCRENLKNNLKSLPLTQERLKNRHNFSKYIYELHEHINKMLGKKSGLSFNEVRERYEHFRSRCTLELNKKQLKKILNKKSNKKTKKKEKGCVEPLYGKKSKCVIKIVPDEEKCNTFQIDKKCIKRII
jgi:hypothetical protein